MLLITAFLVEIQELVSEQLAACQNKISQTTQSEDHPGVNNEEMS